MAWTRVVCWCALFSTACGSDLAPETSRAAEDVEPRAAPVPVSGDAPTPGRFERPTAVEGFDGDGDGVAWPADCDDEDPRRHPGRPEECDGRDNDCDGAPEVPFGAVGPPEIVLTPLRGTSRSAVAGRSGATAYAACAGGRVTGAVESGPAAAPVELDLDARCEDVRVAWVGDDLALIWSSSAGIVGALASAGGSVIISPRPVVATHPEHLAVASGAADGLVVAWSGGGTVRALLLDSRLEVAAPSVEVHEGRAAALDASGGGRGFLVVATVPEGGRWALRTRALDPDGTPRFSQRVARLEPSPHPFAVASTEVGHVVAWAEGERVLAASLSARGTLQTLVEEVARAEEGQQVIDVVATRASGRGLTDGVGLLWSTGEDNGAVAVVAARVDEEARAFGDRLVVGESVPGSLSAAPTSEGFVACGLAPARDGSRSLFAASFETCF